MKASPRLSHADWEAELERQVAAPSKRMTKQAIGLTEETLEKLRDVAWWDRIPIGEVVTMALDEWLAKRKPYPLRQGQLKH